MKARIKATGEIVEFTRVIDKYIMTHHSLPITFDKDELDFDIEDDLDYWTRLEYQYAGMAMQGILSNPALFKATAKNAEEFGLIVPQAVAIDANCFAHALVEKMKEKEE